MTDHTKVDRFFVGENDELRDHVMKIPGFVYKLNFSGGTIAVKPTAYPEPSKVLSSACYLAQHRRRRFRTKVVGSSGPEQLCDFLRDGKFLIEVQFQLDEYRHEAFHRDLDNKNLVHFEVGSDPPRLVTINRKELVYSPKLAEFGQKHKSKSNKIRFIKLDRDPYNFMILANYLNRSVAMKDLDWQQVRLLKEEANYFGFEHIARGSRAHLLARHNALQDLQVIDESRINKTLWASHVRVYVLGLKSVKDENLGRLLNIDTRLVRLILVSKLSGTVMTYDPIGEFENFNVVRGMIERMVRTDPNDLNDSLSEEDVMEFRSSREVLSSIHGMIMFMTILKSRFHSMLYI